MKRPVTEIYRKHNKQYLDEILRDHGFHGLIPSGYILDKTIPNVGATHSELADDTRNSIIITPHKPVIEVKQQIFGSKICGVMEGVSVKDILIYLNGTVQPKKFITTPESFYKVLKALEQFDKDFRKTYFMLIDECDKLIYDCLFRNKILVPMEEFFLFTNKAMVSATPIMPEAKGFEEFKILKLIPQYEYKQELVLLATNNIRAAIRETIASQIKDGKPIFIFTNCKTTIAYITSLAEVAEDYCVFCAEDLKERFFDDQGIQNVKHSVRDQKYSKVNIFTSRFFNGVDMFLDVKPHVIMVTNVPKSRHSMISPAIDSVQISGRARNGISSLTHITNTFKLTQEKSEKDVLLNVEIEAGFVKYLDNMKGKVPNSWISILIDSFKDKVFASVIFDENGEINPYFKQNFELKRLLAYLYSDPERLYSEYQTLSYFRIIKHFVNEIFSDSDEVKLTRVDGVKKRSLLAQKINDTLWLYHTTNEWSESTFRNVVNQIRKLDELTFTAYKEFGYSFLQSIKFSKGQMQYALFRLKQEQGDNELLVWDKIIVKFPLNVPLYCDQIKPALQSIYDEFNFESASGNIKRAKASDIEGYFDFKLCNGKKKDADGKTRSYYILYKPLYKVANDLQFMAMVHHG